MYVRCNAVAAALRPYSSRRANERDKHVGGTLLQDHLTDFQLPTLSFELFFVCFAIHHQCQFCSPAQHACYFFVEYNIPGMPVRLPYTGRLGHEWYDRTRYLVAGVCTCVFCDCHSPAQWNAQHNGMAMCY